MTIDVCKTSGNSPWEVLVDQLPANSFLLKSSAIRHAKRIAKAHQASYVKPAHAPFQVRRYGGNTLCVPLYSWES